MDRERETPWAASGQVRTDSRWAFTTDAQGSVVRFEPTDRAPSGLHRGSPAPAFSVTASDGKPHTLADYAGRPLILDFWATWCAPCVALHPDVIALSEKHGVAVLGISADEDQKRLNVWLRKHPTPWPSAAIGPEGSVNRAYHVSSWPTHALIDAEGALVAYEDIVTALDAVE